MSTETVSYSYTGKAAHAELYGEVTGTPDEIRKIAVSLWCDIRQRQVDEGQKAKAAVWISQKRCQPSEKEIEEYREKVRQILQREADHKESGEADEADLDVVVEDDHKEAPVSEPLAPSVVFDAEDDLDF